MAGDQLPNPGHFSHVVVHFLAHVGRRTLGAAGEGDRRASGMRLTENQARFPPLHTNDREWRELGCVKRDSFNEFLAL